jgi:hypothetical protein
VALGFEGDLTFSVDGPGGSSAGTVRGAGRTLHVHASDPVAAWDAALGSSTTGPALLADVARLLHDEGAVLEVTGPGGRVARVGAGIDSPLGRVLAGSRHVRLGRPAAVRPLAVAQVRRTLRRRRTALGLAALAGLLAATGARRRR